MDMRKRNSRFGIGEVEFGSLDLLGGVLESIYGFGDIGGSFLGVMLVLGVVKDYPFIALTIHKWIPLYFRDYCSTIRCP